MSILDTLAAKLAPHECLGCAAEGSLLCSRCLVKLSAPPSRCYACQRPTFDHATCLACHSSHPLERVVAVTDYGGMAKSLVWRLKSSGAQAAAVSIARAMHRRLSTPVSGGLRCYIVPVPTASSRVRQRGYDQARLLARALARQSGHPYLNCLVRTGQTHQVGADRAQRLQQLSSSFRVSHAALLPRIRIILVDDVMTTGASLEAAARALRRAGAVHVEAMVFAQAPLNKP